LITFVFILLCLTNTPDPIPSAVCVAPPEDEHVMFETCRGH
jgi:hypothetical protein